MQLQIQILKAYLSCLMLLTLKRKGDKYIPKLRRNVAKGIHRSRRVSGQTPQYAGLYCTMEGDKDILDEDISNIVHLDPNTTESHAANRYLKQNSYLSFDWTVEYTHPYTFSLKVQTHDSDNPT